MQNLTILKIEGLGDLTQTECLIYNDCDQLVKKPLQTVISAQVANINSCILIRLQDELTSLHLASVRFSLSILPEAGIHWLPLYLTDDSFIEFIPDQIDPPRVLIDLHPSIMDPIVDITESSDCEEAINDFSPKIEPQNVELMIKVTELQNSLNICRRNSEIQIEETAENYKNQIWILYDQLEKYKKNFKSQEESFNSVLKENEMLKLSLEKIISERNELQAKVTKLERLYESFKKYSGINGKMNEFKLEKIGNIFVENKNFSKSQEIFFLSSKLAELEKKMKKFKGVEEIEEKVNNVLRVLGLEGFLKLADEAVFVVGNKKLNVLVKKNVAQVRCGGFFKTLEAFIGNSCANELQGFMKVRKSLCSSPICANKRTVGPLDLDKIRNSVINKSFELGLHPAVLQKSRSKGVFKVNALGKTELALRSRAV